ncbi:2,3-bisphosphoglycerate-independent phosphoglycerate mutase [Candidatus Uhrbacteria bacterium]|nr:2,3-bisphosphoglycerate-independent phosphoglycerate mutase [Candidatus Uhrbacteria bacterium]
MNGVHRPCILIVLDGWGIAAPSRANAIVEAKTPFFDSLVERYPTAVLQASGEATGLPWSEVGNSEVGHMNIGAGRIVYQDLSRINSAISDRTFSKNTALLSAFTHARDTSHALHIIGMPSASGVHGHIDHLFALCELVQTYGIKRAFLHIFLDGRDAPFASGAGFVRSIEERIAGTTIRIASLSGRRYAMDRDNHWERTELAYRAIAEGRPWSNENPVTAIEQSYASGVYDEEFSPLALAHNGAPVGAIANGDALIFFNIRADRARQIASAFIRDDFNRFERVALKDIHVVTMTQYDAAFNVPVGFAPQRISHSLAECISDAGLKQIHIAETEKYAHITYFLNDGREEPFRGEDRVMISSPRIETYAKKPEMSALEITEAVISVIDRGSHDVIAVNFANADMVGHTGDFKATVAALEVLDRCMRRIVESALAKGGCVFITADHGNAEKLFDLHTGQIDKEHSNNPVPCIMVARELEGRTLNAQDVSSDDLHILEPHGMLSDVAPTLLHFLGIPKASEMTGNDLLAGIIGIH